RRFQAITGRGRKQTERDIIQNFPYLPSGCFIQLDPVAQEIVLENVRRAIGSRKRQIVDEVKRIGNVGMGTFLREAGLELPDIYRSGRSWTTLRRLAGFEARDAGPDETVLARAIGRMLHVEDDLRLGAWADVVAGRLQPAEIDQRLLAMLHVGL